jgi:HAMP domain-containing protein
MGLRLKFNLAIVAVFAVGFAAAWIALERQFVASARDEVLQNARIMMAAANAVRLSTSQRVGPMLAAASGERFEPMSVPSYAAQSNFKALTERYPDFTYKEAALNPTNPADRATDWEADFITAFRSRGGVEELTGERDTPTGKVLTLARPIAVSSEACLRCHSTPDRAPPAMVAQYGANNGFGWTMGETVAAQVVSVPMAVALDKARRNLHAAMGLLAAVFAGVMVVLNVLLHLAVVRPVVRIARIATDVSLGRADAPEFAAAGRDEIGELGRAFTRMRRSLDQAMRMLGA